MKKLILALLFASGAACAAPREIDVIVPLTGPTAFLGKSEQQSLLLLESAIASGAIKAPAVKFVFHDDQSSPQVAVQLATGLIAKKPPVILGSAQVAMCNAMAPLVKAGPVMYCFSPGIHPPAGSFAFTSGVDTRDMVTSLLRYWRLKGVTRIGLITSTDASGQDAERAIRAAIAAPENASMKIVGDARFNPADVSTAAQIQRIKGTDPQALIAWATGAPIGTVFKAIIDAGLDVPVATTNGNMTYAQMTQYAAFLPKELYIPSAQWGGAAPGTQLPADMQKAQADFVAAFKGAGVMPDAASTFSWDPALLVLRTLDALGPEATAEQLRAKLAATNDFTGINGAYDFSREPQRGLDESDVVITRWNAAEKIWQVLSQPRGIPPAN